MRRLARTCLGLLSLTSWLRCGSAPPFASHRLADGSYELACQAPLSLCLDHVDDVCHGTPYDVIGAHDRRKSTDVQLGTYQNEVRSSDATVRCTRNKPLFGGSSEPRQTPQAPQPSSGRGVCTPGATQTCVGPAGCPGGQACLSDGSAFGPCDCGQPARRPDAGID
jgi:hypothetical protein